MKNILVTGGTGAIGSNLVKKLLVKEDTNKVIILDDNSSGYHNNLIQNDKIIFVKGNVCDSWVIEQAFTHEITHVYHLAANFANQSSVDFPEKDLMTNGIGIIKLLEASVKNNVKKFLYSSSSCVYKPVDSPFVEHGPIALTTPYAITKLLSEYYVTFYNKFKDLPCVVVRYFNNYGPGDYPGRFRSVICNFFWKALRKEPLVITGDGSETRPFTFVDDIVDGTMVAMEKSEEKIVKNFYSHPIEEDDNLIYNIANPEVIKIKDLAEKVNDVCGNTAGIEYQPRRNWDVIPNRSVCVEKAVKELGFNPKVNIDEGLKKTLQWFSSEEFKNENTRF